MPLGSLGCEWTPRSKAATSAMLLTLIGGALGVLAVGLSLLTAYLLFLTCAAVIVRLSRKEAGFGPGLRRFGVLIPAHDEETLVGRLLASLEQLDYPRENYDVCVVADNCSDRTADLARSTGARVYERFDTERKAKGFALHWLLEQLRDEGSQYDAFVVLDADSVVSANFLRGMDFRLERGSQVVQAYYSVSNAGQSTVTSLRSAALAAIHYVRPLGRSLLGLSCGLKGNGMCFAASIIERFGWRWFTLAEDVEFHLALIRAGIRVDFAPEATVQADMPVTLAQAATQNARWEQGRLLLVRRSVPGLIARALRTGSLAQLDAAAEQLIPPLSVPFALSGLCVVSAWALGSLELAVLGGLNLLGQMLYVLVGLTLVGAPRQTFVALSTAPVYIAWKLGLYCRALVRGQGSPWVRTTRAAPES